MHIILHEGEDKCFQSKQLTFLFSVYGEQTLAQLKIRQRVFLGVEHSRQRDSKYKGPGVEVPGIEPS